MARGFGATLGVGNSDSINIGLTTHSSQRTWAIAFNRNSAGSGTSLGRLFEKDGTESLFWSSGTSRIRFERFFNSGAGSVRWDLNLTSTGVPYHLIIRYNSSASVNNITAFANGTGLSVPRTTSGTLVDPVVINANPYCIGNRLQDNARGWDGTIAEFAVWDELIPLDVALAISKGVSALVHPRNLIYYAPLIRDVLGIRGGLSPTLVGTAPRPHPRIFYPGNPAGYLKYPAIHEGSGNIQLRSSIAGSGSSSGTPTRTGNGAIGSRASLTGIGSITRQGSGSVAARTAIAATGIITRQGAGGISAGSAVSGMGAIARQGTGGISASSSISGAGAIARIGTGTINVRSAIAGIGTVNGSISGTGNISGRTALTGTGTITRVSSGDVQLRTALAGTGTITRTGSGTIGARLTIAGVGVVGHQGSGAIALLTSAGGSGLVDRGELVSNGAIALATQVAGIGAVIRVGVGALNIRTSINGGGTNRIPPPDRTLIVPKVSRVLFIP